MAAPVSPLSDPSLSVETPERVELSLDVAGLGTRSLAYMVDWVILFLGWMTGLFIYFGFIHTTGYSFEDFSALESFVQALLIFGAFAIQWGYWFVFETLMRGQSPGKRVLKIRVVKIDGSPETVMDVALRNLARVADFLPAFYALGLVSMTVSPRSRRLGDFLAGTVVIRERTADLSRYDRKPSERTVGGVVLSPSEFELVTGFLARAEQLEPSARERVALKVAEPFVKRLAPERQAPLLASGQAAEQFLRDLAGSNG